MLRHSLKTGEFTLKSGRRSAWFLDTKQTACRADGVVLMADVALSLIPDEATAIGGLTVGADPVAYAVAAIGATRGRNLSSFTVRKEAKDHGVTGRVAGALQPGDKVVITEDTVTRGHVADGGGRRGSPLRRRARADHRDRRPRRHVRGDGRGCRDRRTRRCSPRPTSVTTFGS